MHSNKAASDIAEKIKATCRKVEQELADSRASLEEHETNSAMSHLVGDLGGMQEEFAKNGQLLLDVITEVDANYAENVERLTQALGHIQFQDVMRQRTGARAGGAQGDAPPYAVYVDKGVRFRLGRQALIAPSMRCWRRRSADIEWPARPSLMLMWQGVNTVRITAVLQLNFFDSNI